MRDEWMLNSVQTAAILFIAVVLVYVVWRLERAMRLAVSALRVLSKTHDELVESQNAMEDSIAVVWRKLEKIEARQRMQRQ